MFYVTRQSPYSTSDTIIPFEIDQFNTDDLAMNLTTGVFTAPENGIYQFWISGVAWTGQVEPLWIFLRLGRNNVGVAFGSNKTDYTPFALHSMLKLERGEEIDLYLKYTTCYATGYDYGTHFTGTLLVPMQTIVPQPSTAHFYVQRNSSFFTVGAIPFELARLNEGNAMDIRTGVFTAPIDGIYHFSLSGIKDASNQSTWIKLRLNGEMIGSAYALENLSSSYYLQSILPLERGDRVNLFLEKGTLYDDVSHWTHFIGSCFNTKISADYITPPQVYFYAQLNSSYSTLWSRVPFELARLNEGSAMNLTTGIFTAPYHGTYRFSLFGVKDDSYDYLKISLRKNGIPVGISDAFAPGWPFSPFSLLSVLHLKKGDEIDLYLLKGTIFDLEDYHVTHFIGYLLQ